MIYGEFRDGHPRATLTVLGADGPFEVEFIVDTGFEGDVALPARFARRLGAVPRGATDRLLANGDLVKVPVCEAAVVWGDDERPVEVLVLEGNPLLGTQLLLDHQLFVQATPGGEVSAEPL